MTESLINYERTWRTMICLNPKHDIVKFKTNAIGNIICSTCKHIMVVEIKSIIIVEDMTNDAFDE